jgi:hypothetical protein
MSKTKWVALSLLAPICAAALYRSDCWAPFHRLHAEVKGQVTDLTDYISSRSCGLKYLTVRLTSAGSLKLWQTMAPHGGTLILVRYGGWNYSFIHGG